MVGLATLSWTSAAPGLPAPLGSPASEAPSEGRPTVVLDQLDFPKEVVDHAEFRAHLLRFLKREAARADWGAGGGNRIEYRFEVSQLRFVVSEDALTIHCSAVGRLPGGHSAKSELSFGGSLLERKKLTKKVLGIVAHGVLVRLSELERRRRGLR